MKEKDQEGKWTNRLGSLCSASGLLLSVVCCIALIHVEIRIQEQHRLISHSVTSCDQLETKILRKVQNNYARWQHDQDGNSKGHSRHKGGTFWCCSWYLMVIFLFVFSSRFVLNKVDFKFVATKFIYVKLNKKENWGSQITLFSSISTLARCIICLSLLIKSVIISSVHNSHFLFNFSFQFPRLYRHLVKTKTDFTR